MAELKDKRRMIRYHNAKMSTTKLAPRNLVFRNEYLTKEDQTKVQDLPQVGRFVHCV